MMRFFYLLVLLALIAVIGVFAYQNAGNADVRVPDLGRHRPAGGGGRGGLLTGNAERLDRGRRVPASLHRVTEERQVRQ